MTELKKWVIVSGATGFIGTALVKKLLESGHSIVALSRSTNPKKIKHPDLHYCQADTQQIQKIIGNSLDTTTFYHLAWNTHGDFWSSNENLDAQTYSMKIAQIARDLNCIKFISLGTCAEYDWKSDNGNFRESSPTYPFTLYGKIKLETQQQLQSYFLKSSVEFVWLRLFFPFGPGQDPKRFIPYLITSIRNNEPLTCKHPEYKRDYIFLSDIVEILIRIKSKNIQGIFNVGSGKAISISNLIQHVGSILNKIPQITYTELNNPKEPMQIEANMEKTLTALDWRPNLDIIERLTSLVHTKP